MAGGYFPCTVIPSEYITSQIYIIKLSFLFIPLFSLSGISSWVVYPMLVTDFDFFFQSMTNLGKTNQLEIPDRENRGIDRKGSFIIDLRCYKLHVFYCTVGPMRELWPKPLRYELESWSWHTIWQRITSVWKMIKRKRKKSYSVLW